MWSNILNGINIWSDFRIKSSDRTSVLRYAHFLSLRNFQQSFYISLTIHMSYTAQLLIRSIISDYFWCTSEHVLIDILQSFLLLYDIFFLWILGFRTTRNKNRVRSEEIWPIIQSCIFTNRLNPTRICGITPYTNSSHLFISRLIGNSRYFILIFSHPLKFYLQIWYFSFIYHFMF